MARVSTPAFIDFVGVIPLALFQNRRLFETRALIDLVRRVVGCMYTLLIFILK